MVTQAVADTVIWQGLASVAIPGESSFSHSQTSSQFELYLSILLFGKKYKMADTDQLFAEELNTASFYKHYFNVFFEVLQSTEYAG